jgi:uncharacterized SAM-binding protein YcdF (DUF218 family)
MDMSPEVSRLAQIVWDYHHLNHSLRRADCILALGSHDVRVAERAADLWLDGWAPWLVCAGGLGRLTEGVWDRPEGEIFAEIARNRGVPDNRILVESRSTNTGENIIRVQELFEARGMNPYTVIVVQKPYMERRAYATAKLHWPDREIIVTSPQLSLAEYPNEEITAEQLVHIMVGDLQRIPLYGRLGYQIPQEVPDDVWRAFETLVALGYTSHLVEEEAR